MTQNVRKGRNPELTPSLYCSPLTYHMLTMISKIQQVVYYQCCVLIGRATTRLYGIAHQQRKAPALKTKTMAAESRFVR